MKKAVPWDRRKPTGHCLSPPNTQRAPGDARNASRCGFSAGCRARRSLFRLVVIGPHSGLNRTCSGKECRRPLWIRSTLFSHRPLALSCFSRAENLSACYRRRRSHGMRNIESRRYRHKNQAPEESCRPPETATANYGRKKKHGHRSRSSGDASADPTEVRTYSFERKKRIDEEEPEPGGPGYS